MLKSVWLVAMVCSVAVSACGGSDKADGDDTAGESAMSPLTDTLEEAAQVEGIIDQQKQRTDAALEKAEDGDESPKR